MSRAFTPPDTLSKEDVRTIADVRREIWTNGFRGLVFGSLTGYVLHSVARVVHTRTQAAKKLVGPVTFNKNTAFLCVMVGGAVGSFSWATSAGKNNVHNLHGIFDIGSTKPNVNRERWEEEHNQREQRRLMRRKTLDYTLKKGHGLSDSHGGHWVDEDVIMKERAEENARRREKGDVPSVRV